MDEYLVTKSMDPAYTVYTFFSCSFTAYVSLCLYEQYRLAYQGFHTKILNSQFSLFLMAVSLGGIGKWAMNWLEERGEHSLIEEFASCMAHGLWYCMHRDKV